ncbi:MAG: hypothetical protein M3N29_05145 [Chloroflexota bacterium]|nr:hypothetical protein [Chloroflexota bacterium]
MPEIGPAPVLALLVGAFHTGLYLAIRGRFGTSVAFVLLAAVLGALAGQALSRRLGDPLLIGDFGLLWSSLLAWLGIVVVAAASMLAPPRGEG